MPQFSLECQKKKGVRRESRQTINEIINRSSNNKMEYIIIDVMMSSSFLSDSVASGTLTSGVFFCRCSTSRNNRAS